MKHSKTKDGSIKATDYLGKTITVTIDRPIHSRHPKHDFMYELNYGFVPNTLSADGEELDVYVIGVNHPLTTFTGICIAVIHRIDDNDDKLVIVPSDLQVTDIDIQKATHFQEQFFTSIILRK